MAMWAFLFAISLVEVAADTTVSTTASPTLAAETWLSARCGGPNACAPGAEHKYSFCNGYGVNDGPGDMAGCKAACLQTEGCDCVTIYPSYGWCTFRHGCDWKDHCGDTRWYGAALASTDPFKTKATPPPTPLPWIFHTTVSTTASPIQVPTKSPTAIPMKEPTPAPTYLPTTVPTAKPTATPTKAPTTAVPTATPALTFIEEPTGVPTNAPTAIPTKEPTPANSRADHLVVRLQNYDRVGRAYNVKTMSSTNQEIAKLPLLGHPQKRRHPNGLWYSYSDHTKVKFMNWESAVDSTFTIHSRSAWNRRWMAEVGLEGEMKSLASKMAFAGSVEISGDVKRAIAKGYSVSLVRRVQRAYLITLDPDFPLHPSVRSRLSKLDDLLSSNSSAGVFERELAQFFEQYGTHYISEIQVGGRYDTLVKTSACRADHSLKTDASITAEVKKRFAAGGMKAGGKAGHSSVSEMSGASASSSDTEEVKGGKREILRRDGMEAWMNSIHWYHPDSVDEIGFKLDPLWYKMPEWPELKERMREFFYHKYVAAGDEGLSGEVSKMDEVSCEEWFEGASRGHVVSTVALLLTFSSSWWTALNQR